MVGSGGALILTKHYTAASIRIPTSRRRPHEGQMGPGRRL